MKPFDIFIAHYKMSRLFGAGRLVAVIVASAWTFDWIYDVVHYRLFSKPYAGVKKHGTTTQKR